MMLCAPSSPLFFIILYYFIIFYILMKGWRPKYQHTKVPRRVNTHYSFELYQLKVAVGMLNTATSYFS